jgi:hypothetical protein
MRDRVTITFVAVVLPEIPASVIRAEQVVGDHQDGVADGDRRPRIEEVRKELCRHLGVPHSKDRDLHTGRFSCRPSAEASGALATPTSGRGARLRLHPRLSWQYSQRFAHAHAL